MPRVQSGLVTIIIVGESTIQNLLCTWTMALSQFKYLRRRVYIKWAFSPLHSQPKDFLSVAFMKVPPRHYRAVCVPQNNLICLSLSIADGTERTSCIPSNVDWNDSRGVVYRRPSSGEETLYERLLLAKDSSFFIFLLSFLSLTAGRDRKPIYPHQNVPYFYFYCS